MHRADGGATAKRGVVETSDGQRMARWGLDAHQAAENLTVSYRGQRADVRNT